MNLLAQALARSFAYTAMLATVLLCTAEHFDHTEGLAIGAFFVLSIAGELALAFMNRRNLNRRMP